MKKKIISILLVLTMVLSLMPAITVFASAEGETPAWADGGDGSAAATPYIISTYDGLKGFADAVNGGNTMDGEFIKLADDFGKGNGTAESLTTTIGKDWNNPFKGTFDGNNKNVVLAIESTASYVGLFCTVGENGVVKNVSVSGTVSGNSYVGGIVGNNSGTVTNCYSSCEVKSTSDEVGGVVGYNEGGTVANCYSIGNVTAAGANVENVGGVVGYNERGTIINCYATGTVSVTYTGDAVLDCFGGVVGDNEGGKVINCYATGNITLTADVDLDCIGGVVGNNCEGTVENCYATCNVTVNGDFGQNVRGAVGYNNSGTVTNCYSTKTPLFYGDEGIDCYQIDADMKVNDIPLVNALNTYATGSDGAAAGCFKWNAVESYNGGYPYLIAVDTSWFDADKDKFTLSDTADLEGLAFIVNEGTSTFEGKTITLADTFDGTVPFTTPIGDDYESRLFKGTFDGNGKNVVLAIDKPESGNPVGLFGTVGENGVVKNVSTSGSVSGNSSVGGVVGQNGVAGQNGGTVTNCHATGAITCTGSFAGGVVGHNSSSGTVTNCYATGAVSGTATSVGGVVGKNGGTVTNCHATGSVTSTSNNEASAGGVVGKNEGGTVTNCYATGNVKGNEKVGGVVGYNNGTNAKVTNCYATGAVTCTMNQAGGVVGSNNRGTVTNCYTTSEINGNGCLIAGDNSGTVTNCYASNFGDKTLVSGTGTVTNCYKIDADQMKGAVGAKASDNWTSIKIGSEANKPGKVSLVDALNEYVKTNKDAMTWKVDSTKNGGYPYMVGDISWFNTTESEFTLYDTADLEGLAFIVNEGTSNFEGKTITLADDFDGSVALTTPIGNSGTKPFKGTFDGNGKNVVLAINITSDFAGLFGYVEGGNIKNVSTSGSVSGKESVGGVVGYNWNGAIISCSSSCTVSGTSDNVGGIVGINLGGTVTNCYATGDVSGTGEYSYVGGVVGSNNGTVTNCYATGSVSGTGTSWVGGVVGKNNNAVKNCYSTMNKLFGGGSGSGTDCYQIDADKKVNDTPLVDALNNYLTANSTPGAKLWKVDSTKNSGYPTFKDIPYQNYTDGEFNEALCTDYTVVTPSTDAVTWTAGWYVATGEVTITNSVKITGDVKLILCDGAKLTVEAAGYTISTGTGDNDQLSIFGGESGTGKLITKQPSNQSDTSGLYCIKLTINGGIIEASGDNGIWSPNLVINGGNIKATSTYDSNAINGNGNAIKMNGGSLLAIGVNSYCGTSDPINVASGLAYKEADSEADLETVKAKLATGTSVSFTKRYVKITPTEPLTLTGTGKFSVKLVKVSEAPNVKLEYSFDKQTWYPYAEFTDGQSSRSDITVDNENHVIYFRGTGNKSFAKTISNYNKFVLTPETNVKVSASGNIMTLLDYKNAPATLKDEDNKFAFNGLFMGCKCLTTAPELPATTLSSYCYSQMFKECTSLTTAPELPSKEIAYACYREMFNGCTSLTTAPELPATNLSYECYYRMFCGCTDLTTAPKLDATELKDSCYCEMFNGCTKLYVIAGTENDYTWKIPYTDITNTSNTVLNMAKNTEPSKTTVATAATSGGYNYYKVIEAKPMVSVNFGGGVGEKKYTSLQKAIDAAVEGVTSLETAKTVKLIEDVTENIEVAEGKFVILDLNNHVLSGGGSDSVITNKGTLKITDSSSATAKTKRYFTDSKCVHGEAIGASCSDCGDNAVKDGGFETLEANYVTTEKTEYVDYVKTVGGVITGGIAKNSSGVYNTGKLTMTYCSIVGNGYSFAIGNDKDGTLDMENCTVVGNGNGGVKNESTSSLTLKNCIITENNSKNSSGVSVSNGTLTLDGSTTITGNTKNGTDSNLVIKNGKTITIGDNFTGSVGVTLADKTGVFTTNGTEAIVSKFTSDNLAYKVKFVKGDTTQEATSPLYNDHLELVTFDTAKFTDKTVDVTLENDSMTVDQAKAIAGTLEPEASDKLIYAKSGTNYKYILYTEQGWGDEQTGTLADIKALPGDVYVIGETVEKTVLTITAGTDSVITVDWSGEDTDISSFVTSKNGETPVTDIEYTYTWYASDDASLANALQSVPTEVGVYQVVVAVKDDNELYTGKSAAVKVKILPVAVEKDGDGHKTTEASATYALGGSDTITFSSVAAFDDFIKVLVNGEVLADTNYELAEGSIQVTLKNEYLETLKAGDYVFEIVSKLPGGESEETVSVSYTVTVKKDIGNKIKGILETIFNFTTVGYFSLAVFISKLLALIAEMFGNKN